MAVVIETTIGNITVDLFHEERPRTCMNFLKLCKMKYYNLNLVYSIERNFLAQMGDPSGTGRGGSSIFSEIYGEQARFYEGEKVPVMKHIKLGTVSMVSCSKDHLFGSQFFITLGENLDSLDGEHLVFGQVSEGLDTLEILNKTLTDDNYRPYQDIRITHTVVLHDPYPDNKELEFPSRSPSPTKEILESNYIAVDEEINDTEGKTFEEIHEDTANKESKTRATILEMLGDLPDAEVAPDENVLFICKLNPVTTSEDLEIIFSRFGKINSCEIIFDKMTKNSLQYGFIEFAGRKACEDAYFKMDNVLIDDRRIHVDFNQSVARLRWKGKGKIEYYDEKGRKTDDPSVFNPNKISKKSKKDFSPPNKSSHNDRKNDRHFNYIRKRDNNSRDREQGNSKYKNYSSRDRDSESDRSYPRYKHEHKERDNRDRNSRYNDRGRYDNYKSRDSKRVDRRDDRYESRDYRNENVKTSRNNRTEDLNRTGKYEYRRDNERKDNWKSRERDTNDMSHLNEKRKTEFKSRIPDKRHKSESSSDSSESSNESSEDEKTKKLMKKLEKEIKKAKKKKKKHSKKKKSKVSSSSDSD